MCILSLYLVGSSEMKQCKIYCNFVLFCALPYFEKCTETFDLSASRLFVQYTVSFIKPYRNPVYNYETEVGKVL